MANYFNRSGYVWTLVEGKMTYRIVIGTNKDLPEGLEKKYPSQLLKIQEAVRPAAPPPTPEPTPAPEEKLPPAPDKVEVSEEKISVPEAPKAPEKDPKAEALKVATDTYEMKIEEINASDKPKRSKNASIKYWEKWLEEEKRKIAEA